MRIFTASWWPREKIGAHHEVGELGSTGAEHGTSRRRDRSVRKRLAPPRKARIRTLYSNLDRGGLVRMCEQAAMNDFRNITVRECGLSLPSGLRGGCILVWLLKTVCTSTAQRERRRMLSKFVKRCPSK
jgi:hypothetical protein